MDSIDIEMNFTGLIDDIEQWRGEQGLYKAEGIINEFKKTPDEVIKIIRDDPEKMKTLLSVIDRIQGDYKGWGISMQYLMDHNWINPCMLKYSTVTSIMSNFEGIIHHYREDDNDIPASTSFHDLYLKYLCIDPLIMLFKQSGDGNPHIRHEAQELLQYPGNIGNLVASETRVDLMKEWLCKYQDELTKVCNDAKLHNPESKCQRILDAMAARCKVKISGGYDIL